mgnify:CR=1 FL=1
MSYLTNKDSVEKVVETNVSTSLPRHHTYLSKVLSESIPGNGKKLGWLKIIKNSGGFAVDLGSTEVTCNVDGWFIIVGSVTVQVTGNNNKEAQAKAYLKINDQKLEDTDAYGITHGNTFVTVISTTLVELYQGDVISLHVEHTAGKGTMTLVSDLSKLIVQEIKR